MRISKLIKFLESEYKELGDVEVGLWTSESDDQELCPVDEDAFELTGSFDFEGNMLVIN